MTTDTWNAATAPGPLVRALGKNWWLFLLRGVAAIAFGVLSLIWPGISLVTLILLYGAYAFVDGIFALGAAIFGKVSIGPRWWLVLVGLAGIAAGIATFVWPGLTALVLLFFIAAWAIASGIFQIIGAIQIRKEIDNEWWLILDGAISVLFGILLFVMPGTGALALIWLIAFYAILYGALMIGFAFKLHSHAPQTA
ncbi:MAG TPA: HdeD family acid-resistance protein [Pseudolabrys sp.]|nr:HdeD family acid-resistance protein [Pseudolabrys sp.]